MKRRAFFQNVAAIAAAPVAAKLVPDVTMGPSAPRIPYEPTYETTSLGVRTIWGGSCGPFVITTGSHAGPWHEETHDALMAKADAARKGGK